MKKIVLLLTFTFLFNLQALSFEDSRITAQNFNKQGDLALSHAMKAQKGERKFFLKEAKWFYEQSTKAYTDNLNGFLGLARSYMYLGRFNKAYNNFMVAYNFDNNNPLTNYYLGEYNFLNEKYMTALEFYKAAYRNGYTKHYNTNFQIALCYDKLGDAPKATEYYKKCLKIDSKAKEPRKKLAQIETKDEKYKDYYEFYQK